MELNMSNINEIAKRFDCIPLTENDYKRLITFGRLITINAEKTKISSYWYRGSKFAPPEERCLSLSSRFEGDGERSFEVIVSSKDDQICGPLYSANLQPFATNMAVTADYQSDSFCKHYNQRHVKTA